MVEPETSKKRRSPRAELELLVLIRTTAPDRTILQVQGFTSVVSAHGGILDSPLELKTNQSFSIINPNSRKGISCRVVNVSGPKESMYKVAFEFEETDTTFWHIGPNAGYWW